MTALLACILLVVVFFVTSVVCTDVRNCTYNATRYVEEVTSDSCATSGTRAECVVHPDDCGWDAFIGVCYRDLTMIEQLFPCSCWTPFGGPSFACLFHDCMLIGDQCISPDDVPMALLANASTLLANTEAVESNALSFIRVLSVNLLLHMLLVSVSWVVISRSIDRQSV